MSLPKKGSRKIRVGDIDYLWIAKGSEQINLIICPVENGNKILTSFSYNFEQTKNNTFNYQFVITPYVVRKVILYGIKNGYSASKKSGQMNLGNLTGKLNLNLSGERKIKKLIKQIEKRININNFKIKEREMIEPILNETKSFIDVGECFIGFEIMISNLCEINFQIEHSELILIKEIFEKENVDWKENWNWIEKMKTKYNTV